MADNKTDTGTGGFEIDGKVYTYDTGLPDAQGGSQGSVDHGNVKVDDSVKDLTKPTKVTLGQYLSDKTKGRPGAGSKGTPNRYSIDPGSTEIDVSGDKGNPSPLTAPNNAEAFAPIPPTSFSDSFSTTQGKFKKGKSSANIPDGNDLLRNAPNEPPNGTVSTYRSAVLATNRFTDAARAAVDSFGIQVTDQTVPGSFDSKSSTISQGRLAQVGPLLTLRAGIELGSNTDGANPNSARLAAGAILPGVAQLAISRVDAVMLNAKDVLDHLTTDDVPDANIISPGTLSWGAMNNTEDQFSGIASLGMAALSTALVAGLLLVIDGFSIVLGLVTPQLKHASRDAQGRYALGSYYTGLKKNGSSGLLGAASAVLSLDMGSLLGIQPTNFPFSVSLKKGANAFFGIDDSGGVLGQLIGAATSGLSADAGYNAVVARAIIRSSLSIVDQIKKIGGNPINAAKQVLNLIDVLRSSKIISACNVFAQLGDAVLSVPDAWTDPDANGGTKISSMDASNLDSVIGRSRRPGSLKLAWASNRAPANLLLSQQIGAVSRVGKKLGSFDPYAGVQNLDNRLQSSLIMQDATPRIDPEDAAAFEKMLEGEYVPFYFHDIRTNEMLSFHAFLASLTDDYTANYESVEAYGRVEAVKIYKSTQRNISLSFYIVSTSSEDLDDMYVKINKLVTLVYPQFTQGKQLSDEAGNFIFTQPFSQLIGASPMIRLRLGDLFKTNYSRFNLARLFGLGNTNFTLDGKKFSNFDKFDQDAITQLLPQKLEDAKKTSGRVFIPKQGTSYQVSPDTSPGGASLPIPNPLGGSGGPKNASSFTPTGVPDFFEVTVERELDDNNVVCSVQLTTDPELLIALSDIIDKIKKEYDNGDLPLQRVVGGQYVFPKHCLQPTRKTQEELIDQIVDISENDEFVQPLTDFMNPENNAIVKSFRDTGGKGLAGFINSMNFDWYDKVTWETGYKDRIAPKMCKVSITFSPVHDITPGLDHLGSNRAPVYPVGLLAQRPESK